MKWKLYRVTNRRTRRTWGHRCRVCYLNDGEDDEIKWNGRADIAVISLRLADVERPSDLCGANNCRSICVRRSGRDVCLAGRSKQASSEMITVIRKSMASSLQPVCVGHVCVCSEDSFHYYFTNSNVVPVVLILVLIPTTLCGECGNNSLNARELLSLTLPYIYYYCFYCYHYRYFIYRSNYGENDHCLKRGQFLFNWLLVPKNFVTEVLIDCYPCWGHNSIPLVFLHFYIFASFTETTKYIFSRLFMIVWKLL